LTHFENFPARVTFVQRSGWRRISVCVRDALGPQRAVSLTQGTLESGRSGAKQHATAASSIPTLEWPHFHEALTSGWVSSERSKKRLGSPCSYWKGSVDRRIVVSGMIFI
jgi:hypothetical protein